MAWVNTGEERSLTFTITKTIGGVIQVGYPKEYDGRLAFLTYSAITDTEAQQLSTSQYNTRLAAFVAYVESIEAGFDGDTDFTNDATNTDLTACPPPPTTTTTTTPPTTTTTTAAITTTTTTTPITTTTTTT